MVYKKRENVRKNKRSQKKVHFGGERVIKDYSDPKFTYDCEGDECMLFIDNEFIREKVPLYLIELITKNNNNLPDEIKKYLGLTIEELYKLAECSLEELQIPITRVPNIIHKLSNKYLIIEVYRGGENKFEVVLHNEKSKKKYRIGELDKQPDLIQDNLTNEKKIQLKLDLHKFVELKRKCQEKRKKIEEEREKIRLGRVREIENLQEMDRREKSRLTKLQKEKEKKEEEKRKRDKRLEDFDNILAKSVEERKKKRNQKKVLNKQNKQNEIATLDIGEDEKKQSPPKGKKRELISSFAGNEEETAYLNCECSNVPRREFDVYNPINALDTKLKKNECYLSDPDETNDDVIKRCADLQEKYDVKIEEGTYLGGISGGRMYRKCNEEYDRKNLKDRNLEYDTICNTKKEDISGNNNPITVIGGSKTKKINKKNKRSKVRSQKKRKGKK